MAQHRVLLALVAALCLVGSVMCMDDPTISLSGVQDLSECLGVLSGTGEVGAGTECRAVPVAATVRALMAHVQDGCMQIKWLRLAAPWLS